MKNIRFYLVISLAVFLAAACSPCKNLRQQDTKLYSQFEQLKEKRAAGKITDEKYLDKVRALRTKELKLFEQAQTCPLEGAAYDYWFKDRLKFPSPLEQELN